MRSLARTHHVSSFFILLSLTALPALLSSCSDSRQADEPGPGGEAGSEGETSTAIITPEDAVGTITEGEVCTRIGVLAHDSMGGRDTPSPGLEMAAAWAAQEFADMGLTPGGDDGGYIQRWDFTPRGGSEGEAASVAVPNVVGLLEGSDPGLRDEWVVFTAHFDHVSGGPDETGDSIYNGADDNASGTSAVMEIAQAFAMLTTPPRRSLAFVLVSGEEKGLLGARHFARGASLPQDAMVADINADMVSMNWPDSILVVGREYTTLGATLDRVLQEHPEVGISVMENPWPRYPFFFMSDQAAFALEGIPGIFFFSGLHDNLHRPGDQVEAVDCDKASRVARLMFHLGYEVAQAPERPAWTEEGGALLAEMEAGEG